MQDMQITAEQLFFVCLFFFFYKESHLAVHINSKGCTCVKNEKESLRSSHTVSELEDHQYLYWSYRHPVYTSCVV